MFAETSVLWTFGLGARCPARFSDQSSQRISSFDSFWTEENSIIADLFYQLEFMDQQRLIWLYWYYSTYLAAISSIHYF